MKYNYKVIEFLLKSFVEMQSKLNDNTKAVQLFKANTNGLVNISQARKEDAELVYKILGIKNTNALRKEWKDKVNSYLLWMHICLKLSEPLETSVYEVLNELELNKIITRTVKNLLFETFNVNSNTVKFSLSNPKNNKPLNSADINKQKLSNSDINKKSINNADINNQNAKIGDKYNANTYVNLYANNKVIDFSTFIREKYKVQIKNPDAVCSGDPYYLYFNLVRMVKSKNILESILSCELKYNIVKKERVGDGCRGYEKTINTKCIFSFDDLLSLYELSKKYFELKTMNEREKFIEEFKKWYKIKDE